MKGFFIEASATMLAKNLLPIAEYFTSNLNEFQATFLSFEISNNVDNEIENSSIQKIVQKNNYKYLKQTSFKPSTIRKILIANKPDFIFIGAYRIYDQLWAGIARKLGIKIYKLQHGFEVESVYYKSFTIIKKAFKVYRLFTAAFYLAKISNTNPFVLIYQYQRYIIKGTSLKNTLLNNNLFHPDLSFVYSNYYKNFWNEKFGFDKNKMTLIMPQDFLLINSVIEKPQQDAICYITQTLVEDGRIKEKDFTKILNYYLGIAELNKKIIVKLHPRSNVKLYRILTKNKNIEFTRDFPNCKFYITHYNSSSKVEEEILYCFTKQLTC